jgi:RNA polymerase primary sigma factor
MYGINDNDAIQAYLRAAWDAPMLSREREVELANLIAGGGARAKRARDELITAHLKLGVKVARKWSRGKNASNFEDLVQEANIGLCVAADKFEVERGFRFATCAWHWVNAQCQLYVADSRGTGDIRLPLSRQREVRRLKNAMKALAERNVPVTDEALAREMDCSVAHVKDLTETLLIHEVSLNTPIGDGGTEYGALLVDERSPNALEMLLDADQKRQVEKAVADLPERDKAIVTMRFGLDGEGERTLEEVSQVFGVTRERIRQLEVKALEKLRSSEPLRRPGVPVKVRKRKPGGRPAKQVELPVDLPPAVRRTRRRRTPA